MTDTIMKQRRLSGWSVLLVPAVLGACTVGPDYRKPDAPVAKDFKEAGQAWRQAAPADAIDRGAWWAIYNDPVLDGLERQVEVSNQTLKQALAQFEQAKALVDEADASFWPTVSVSPTATRSKSAGFAGSSNAFAQQFGGGGTISNNYSASASASWDLDLWGRIRRTVEANEDTAQADAADVANARLSAQATLASDYFQMRGADQLASLLHDTVDAFKRSLKITQDQYNAGTAAKTDVIAAQTQLQSAQSQEINVGVQRAALEHAIATLIGKTPDAVTIAPAPLAEVVPVTPAGVASRLLERRPDIAAAERLVAAANAQIGVAVAAFYPDLTLTGSDGFTSSTLDTLFRAANNVWSLGAAASETIFDAGARSAAVAAARASYDASVANYRQTVLGGFQQVEDELAALRILEQQHAVEQETVKSAHHAVQLFLNQYKAGTVAYTAVITAQATALSEDESLLTIQQNRMIASVTLIEALGGGWSVGELPTPDQFEDYDQSERQADAKR